MKDFYRGDTKRITLQAERNELPIDLTDGIILLSMKKHQADTEYALQTEAELTAPELGEAVITLLPEDTEKLEGWYLYDIELTESDGTVTTLDCGRVQVLKDVG